MLLPYTILGFAVLGAIAKEMPVNEELSRKLYKSGVRHNEIMKKKHATWAAQRSAGAFGSSKWNALAAVDGPVSCVDGKAAVVKGDPLNTFRCKNIDFYSFLSHGQMGSAKNQSEGSSSWGWTSPDGRELVAVGQSDGAAFVEISKEGKLLYLGRLPQYSTPAIWREIRGYKNYMVIGSEAVGHNIQVFDMTKLLTIDPKTPTIFHKANDVSLFKGLPVGRTHNVVVNEELNYAVAVGAQPRSSSCKAGLIFIDLNDISNLTSPGCASQDGYVHDAQCLVYRGPHTKYAGRDICYGYNEDTLTIYDVTDKKNTSVISRTSYTGASYTHQGWVLDKMNQEFLLMDDEYDEYDKVQPAADGHPVTYIWDIRDLEKPKQTGIYKSTTAYSIDHNQYVIGNFSYQSNYGSGLRVIDVSSIPSDPTGKGVKEVAFFDIYPEDDAEPNGGSIDFLGSWSSYAYFKSGFIFVNTIERGGFVVKRTDV